MIKELGLTNYYKQTQHADRNQEELQDFTKRTLQPRFFLQEQSFVYRFQHRDIL